MINAAAKSDGGVVVAGDEYALWLGFVALRSEATHDRSKHNSVNGLVALLTRLAPCGANHRVDTQEQEVLYRVPGAGQARQLGSVQERGGVPEPLPHRCVRILYLFP